MDIIGAFLPTLWGLFLTGIQLTIPLLIATMIGLFVFNYVQHRTKWKWIGSTILTLFGIIALVLFIFHIANIWNGIQDTNIDQIPPDIREQIGFADTQPNILFLLGGALIQSIVTGIVLSLLVLPAAFLGMILFEFLKKRVKGVWSRIALTCFIGSLLFILLVAAFPWIIVSLVYLAFFGI